MNFEMDSFLQKLFHTTTLEETDVLEIEQLAHQYPYYAPLQYLLAKKYSEFDYSKYRSQITKTSIFFSNSHWLNDLLLSDSLANAAYNNTVVSKDVQILTALPVLSTHENIASDIIGEPFSADRNEIASLSEIPAELEEVIPDEVRESLVNESGSESLELPVEMNAATAAAVEENTLEAPDVTASDTLQQNEATINAESNLKTANYTDGDQASSPTPEIPERSLPPLTIKYNPTTPLTETDNMELIPIEPLYAVDYFASQGIKLSIEEGKDKLSQKLRSFTEWLKTMKRIHPEKLEKEMDPQTSSVIQHIAEHSNDHEEVLTEAMAEVYARQGLQHKAAEVYQKLSLLNPNKRTYFAARISKLKET